MNAVKTWHNPVQKTSDLRCHENWISAAPTPFSLSFETERRPFETLCSRKPVVSGISVLCLDAVSNPLARIKGSFPVIGNLLRDILLGSCGRDQEESMNRLVEQFVEIRNTFSLEGYANEQSVSQRIIMPV